MNNNYSIILDRKRAKEFSVFLHSVNIGFEGSECGEHIFFTLFRVKPAIKPVVESFLEKIYYGG